AKVEIKVAAPDGLGESLGICWAGGDGTERLDQRGKVERVEGERAGHQRIAGAEAHIDEAVSGTARDVEHGVLEFEAPYVADDTRAQFDRADTVSGQREGMRPIDQPGERGGRDFQLTVDEIVSRKAGAAGEGDVRGCCLKREGERRSSAA